MRGRPRSPFLNPDANGKRDEALILHREPGRRIGHPGSSLKGTFGDNVAPRLQRPKGVTGYITLADARLPAHHGIDHLVVDEQDQGLEGPALESVVRVKLKVSSQKLPTRWRLTRRTTTE